MAVYGQGSYRTNVIFLFVFKITSVSVGTSSFWTVVLTEPLFNLVFGRRRTPGTARARWTLRTSRRRLQPVGSNTRRSSIIIRPQRWPRSSRQDNRSRRRRLRRRGHDKTYQKAKCHLERHNRRRHIINVNAVVSRRYHRTGRLPEEQIKR